MEEDLIREIITLLKQKQLAVEIEEEVEPTAEEAAIEELRAAFAEVKRIEKGQSQAISLKELLDEL